MSDKKKSVIKGLYTQSAPCRQVRVEDHGWSWGGK